jgi:glycosyltransferase involved in cell wall biosynthesis
VVDKIDHNVVTYLGAVRYEDIFDYHYFADVGIVLAQGEIQHNESSKIYYYLRTGLPVASEEPVPNNDVIREANLGFIVPYNDIHAMVKRIEEGIYKKWDRARAVDYILKNHTWNQRVQKYYRIIREELLTTGLKPDRNAGPAVGISKSLMGGNAFRKKQPPF